jgi:DNA-binding PadR family transcriptional regulator
MDTIAGDSLRGHLDAMVLSLLEQGPAHGFEVLRRLEGAGSGALRLKEGTLYPALYRLEGSGLVRGAWEDDAARPRGPRRRVYALTRKGKARLARARQEWQVFVKVIGGIVGAPS